MAMSDCMHCWSTPCCCGKDGYLAIYPSKENFELYGMLTGDELDLIAEALSKELNRILKELRTATK